MIALTVNAHLDQNILTLKDLLTLYNGLSHPTGIQEKIPEQLDFIEVIFISPKFAYRIEPKKEHITVNLKNLYTRSLFRRCLGMCDATNITLRKFVKE